MSEESDALLHIADDHPCCKPTLLWTHNHLLELERENAALKQRIIDDNKAYGCEIRDPSGTIWDHAQKLQKENAELREDKARLDYIFWPSGSKRARACMAKIIVTAEFRTCTYPHLWRASIDIARKKAQQ